MSIKEYSSLLSITKLYNDRNNLVYEYIKEIIEISIRMKYTDTLEFVKNFLEKYGEIKTTRIDDKNVSYIILNPTQEAKEQIINLKHQVYDQQERDFSEKILCL